MLGQQIKQIQDETKRLDELYKKLYEKGDFEGALNAYVDKIKLNYNDFVSSIVNNPDDIFILNCMKNVDKKSRTYARAKYHIGRALDTTYPGLAKQAEKIIKKY